MSSILTVAITALAALAPSTHASPDPLLGDASDLTSFVTRPEIKAPRLNIIKHSEGITPGYIFTAPYAPGFFQQNSTGGYYQPCQTGPTIYDMDGELVWSGACQVRNWGMRDFRPVEGNGTMILSGVLMTGREGEHVGGVGVVWNSSFETVGEVKVAGDVKNVTMHEFELIDDERRALYVMQQPWQTELSGLKASLTSDWVLDMGFREVDMATRDVLFEWWAGQSEHVSVVESKAEVPSRQSKDEPWDWFHGDSVDKSAGGDYLFSGRYTDTIYKISGQDGSVLWRLGGLNSSFAFSDNSSFAQQHDARWLSVEGNTETISFFNNAVEEEENNSSSSLSSQTKNSSSLRTDEEMKNSASLQVDEQMKSVTSLNTSIFTVELNTSNMTGKVLSQVRRPDRGTTREGGDHQVLRNDNLFVSWGENSYVSEHSPDGTLLMEAQFVSKRFVTYRAYKAVLTSLPTEPPVVKGFVYGTSEEKSTTVLHVSWNGATEVDSWRFNTTDGKTIGEKKRAGFETMFQIDGFHEKIFAEALAANGSMLGVSETEVISRPQVWNQEAAHDDEPKIKGSDLALCVFLAGAVLSCGALWLWRRTEGVRSKVWAGKDRAYSAVAGGNEESSEGLLGQMEETRRSQRPDT